MLTPDFAFCHTAMLERWQGRELNRETYGPPEQVRCRINLRRQRTWIQGGSAAQEAVASAKVYLPGGTQIDVQDRLTAFGRRYTVNEVMRRFNLDGTENHVEAVLL